MEIQIHSRLLDYVDDTIPDADKSILGQRMRPATPRAESHQADESRTEEQRRGRQRDGLQRIQ